jgi:D-glycero-alpha-D-manno-heptose-7-phosphate kinase
MDTRETDLEITSVADDPAGTGLGSSSSFTAAVLRGLHVHQRRYIDTAQLAELTCHVEVDRIHEPIGKQDQHITAFGGLTAFTFNADDTVNVESLPISEDTLADLSDNMLLFFTGCARDASQILREQDVKSRAANPHMSANLHKVKTLGYRTRDAFVSGGLVEWGEIM